MKNSRIIPSVNFHLWEPCNMRCKFCFATFQDVKKQVLPKGHLPKKEAIQVIKKLAEFGFKKITFAGGEPTLCPWLTELIECAKELGMTTMLVTNGTRLDLDFIRKSKFSLDWIALSVDSLCNEVNITSGRGITGKRIFDKSEYIEIANRIREFGFGLKINTVVHQMNYMEDMNDFISLVNPSRWKVLQVLPIQNQNSESVNPFLINQDKFSTFISTHKNQKSLVPETNAAIKGSYVMVDPAGRFFDNTNSGYRYSNRILDSGVQFTYSQMNYSSNLFLERGGGYDWEKLKE